MLAISLPLVAAIILGSQTEPPLNNAIINGSAQKSESY
jgi:hypothetical protein